MIVQEHFKCNRFYLGGKCIEEGKIKYKMTQYVCTVLWKTNKQTMKTKWKILKSTKHDIHTSYSFSL